MFDTENDPHELHNLAADPEYADKLAELRAECDRWMKAIDDKGLIPEPEFIESIWPDKQRPLTAVPEAHQESALVSLKCQTEGASIGYQIVSPGGSLGKVWTVYADPFAVAQGDTIKAIAHRIGYLPSQLDFIGE